MRVLPIVFLSIGTMLVMTGRGEASIVALNQTTAAATFSQTNFDFSESIDGSFDDANGWAIDPLYGDQTAVFETVANTDPGGGTLLTFQLHQLFAPISNPQHLLGRFRLSATTDDRNDFANGLQTGGDVTANWTELTPFFADSSGVGDTLTVLGDNSVLAGGTTPNFAVYTIQALTSLTGITGFRLEMLEDPSLPFGGPGRQPSNGNFVLSEITVDAVVVPEQSALAVWLLLGATVSGGLAMRRAKS